MGRVFATIYRVVLTSAAVAALILSILSATSCSFLDYDHQYKSTRYLQDGAVAGEPEIAETFGGTPTSRPANVIGGTPFVPTVYLEELKNEVKNGEDTILATITETTSTVLPEDTADVPGLDEAMNLGTLPTSGIDLSSNEVDQAEPVVINTSSGLGDMVGSNVTGMNDEVGGTQDNDAFGYTGNDDLNSNSSLSGFDFTNTGTADNQALNTGKATTEPDLIVHGSAGLFCEADDESITNIWKGSLKDSEAGINEESVNDQSEELARNGVIVATSFGVLMALILILELIFGWKIWCERWIVSLLAVAACMAQGITFLLFNSERYW